MNGTTNAASRLLLQTWTRLPTKLLIMRARTVKIMVESLCNVSLLFSKWQSWNFTNTSVYLLQWIVVYWSRYTNTKSISVWKSPSCLDTIYRYPCLPWYSACYRLCSNIQPWHHFHRILQQTILNCHMIQHNKPAQMTW